LQGSRSSRSAAAAAAMFQDRSTLACMVVASYLHYPKQLYTVLCQGTAHRLLLQALVGSRPGSDAAVTSVLQCDTSHSAVAWSYQQQRLCGSDCVALCGSE
jgi:hypothetical protein